MWSDEQLSKLQSEDNDIALVHAAFAAGVKPSANDITTWSAVAKRYWREWDRLRIFNVVLRRAWFENTGKEISLQLLVPRELIPAVLRASHDNPLTGHFAVKRYSVYKRCIIGVE